MSNNKWASEPLRHGLKTEKAQRKLVESLKKSNKQGIPSGWFRRVSAVKKKKESELSRLQKQRRRLDFKIDKILDEIMPEKCHKNMKCTNCQPNGDCDICDTIDGVDMEVVNNYASTCDECHELTMHVDMEMDQETQFGYCPRCSSERKKNERKSKRI